MYHPTSTVEWNPHGSTVYTRGGAILQAIGIPTPPGFIAAIPKYVPCASEQTPWLRASGRYCRVVRDYGPLGVEDAWALFRGVWSHRRGPGDLYDGVYTAYMPYVGLEEVDWIVDPRGALNEAVSSGVDPVVSVVAALVEGSGIRLAEIGLTGSYAAGIASPSISDVDLVVYGAEAAVRVRELFTSTLEPVEGARGNYGGVKIHPPQGTRWRRALLNGVPTSWVGVPERPASHCPPIRGYPNIDPPSGRRVRARVRVEGGHPSALLYPPCIESRDYYIVSFEFNVADMLFRGGTLEVEAVESLEGTTLYIGLREDPGSIKVIA